MKECRLCGDPTEVVFNIRLHRVPVCERCACSITMQQATDVMGKRIEEEKIKKRNESEN